jgi:hypothetical protein
MGQSVAEWLKPLKTKGKGRQRELVACLEHLVDRLNETFAKDVILRKKEHQHWPLVWPEKKHLKELNRLIFALAGWVRKKNLLCGCLCMRRPTLAGLEVNPIS